MNMNITYEDGLRLSELNGRLAQMQYNLDHIDLTMLSTDLAICAAIGFCIALLSCILYSICIPDEGWYGKHGEEFARRHRKQKYIWLAATVVVAMALCFLTCQCAELITVNSIRSDMSNVQAQIDAILSKYGS